MPEAMGTNAGHTPDMSIYTNPDARAWAGVQGATLTPRAFAAYRDNAVIYRS